MKFTASALILAITMVQLAIVGNASLVSSVSQKRVMKRDDHSQHQLEKRIVPLGVATGLIGSKLLGGALIRGIGSQVLGRGLIGGLGSQMLGRGLIGGLGRKMIAGAAIGGTAALGYKAFNSLRKNAQQMRQRRLNGQHGYVPPPPAFVNQQIVPSF
jgi:uncharacterized membrane protein YebE (DUF533 family)